MHLNLNEQLLRDTRDANICIFIANLATWLRINIDREKYEHRNIRDGHCWSYNSVKELQNYFDFWSIKNIRTIIKNAEQAGLIIIGNFNKHKYDKTSWYSLTDKALEYYPILRDKLHERIVKTTKVVDLPETANVFCPNGEPIPKNITTSNINTNITTTAPAALKKKQVAGGLILAMIAVYRDIFPNNPQPHAKLISTTLQKTLQTLIKRWPEADPNGAALDVPAFRRYLIALRDFAPKFSLNEYVTKDGNKKKNGMETFCRWNTLVNFLENNYS